MKEREQPLNWNDRGERIQMQASKLNGLFRCLSSLGFNTFPKFSKYEGRFYEGYWFPYATRTSANIVWTDKSQYQLSAYVISSKLNLYVKTDNLQAVKNEMTSWEIHFTERPVLNVEANPPLQTSPFDLNVFEMILSPERFYDNS